MEGVGPEMAMSEGSAIWDQKSQDFQGPPLPMAHVMNLPASKSLSQAPNKETGTLVILCTRPPPPMPLPTLVVEACITVTIYVHESQDPPLPMGTGIVVDWGGGGGRVPQPTG